MKESALSLLKCIKRMQKRSLLSGSAGNLSLRLSDSSILITPSGLDYEDMEAKDMVLLDKEGKLLKQGALKPSSELPFHLALYAARPDINAVIHTHSPWATSLACLNQPLPPVHYMIASSGRSELPLIPYALFGSEKLSAYIVEGMREGKAALLANHGLLCLGKNLQEAFYITEEVEFVAGLYIRAKAAGKPSILKREDMDEVLNRFESYKNFD